MAKEIERKFLVRDDRWRDGAGEATRIRQFYVLAQDGRSLRVRVKNDARARLTLKIGGSSLVRDEFEYEIPLAEAVEMERFALGAVIAKTRRIARHGALAFEVDVFEEALSGLTLAELESERQVAGDDLPRWLGTEVTGDARYYNLALALNGLPERVA